MKRFLDPGGTIGWPPQSPAGSNQLDNHDRISIDRLNLGTIRHDVQYVGPLTYELRKLAPHSDEDDSDSMRSKRLGCGGQRRRKSTEIAKARVPPNSGLQVLGSGFPIRYLVHPCQKCVTRSASVYRTVAIPVFRK